MEAPKTPSSQNSPEKKKQARDNGILEFKLSYSAIVTETDMWPDGIEERNHKLIPQSYSDLSLNRDA